MKNVCNEESKQIEKSVLKLRQFIDTTVNMASGKGKKPSMNEEQYKEWCTARDARIKAAQKVCCFVVLCVWACSVIHTNILFYNFTLTTVYLYVCL